jgi:hypothetical protein
VTKSPFHNDLRTAQPRDLIRSQARVAVERYDGLIAALTVFMTVRGRANDPSEVPRVEGRTLEALSQLRASNQRAGGVPSLSRSPRQQPIKGADESCRILDPQFGTEDANEPLHGDESGSAGRGRNRRDRLEQGFGQRFGCAESSHERIRTEGPPAARDAAELGSLSLDRTRTCTCRQSLLCITV